MSRYLIVTSSLVLSLLCGCGGNPSSKPVSQETPAKPTTSAVVVTADEPSLESVPSQDEPAQPGGSPATQAFDKLVKAAESGDADGWASSEAELLQLGVAAVPALTARLTDANTVARELAAMFLAQLGPDAAPAAKGLVKLLNDESTFARVNAAAALSTFDGYAEHVAPVLTALLTDADLNVRLTAATSLRNTGAEANKSIAALTRSLNDPDSRVRAAAATTLGELGTAATQSLPSLKQLEADTDEQVANAAARAIRRIDESAPIAAPTTIPASATE